jgi:hypothetical protein
VVVEIVRTRRLDRGGDREVKSAALRSNDGTHHRLADTVVREVEALAELAEDPVPDQLLPALRRLAVRQGARLE